MSHRSVSGDGYEPGDRIGSYAIEKELGRTPSGVMYRAEHVVLPRRVTIRVMHAVQIWLRPIAVQMMREACFLEALQHAGAPRVFECGMLADRRAWIATEAIEGTLVAELIARGPIPVDTVAALVRDVAEVLEHAHRRGVVHRGVRPGSIVYTTGRAFPICLVDWSDARAHDASSAIPHVPTPSTRAYIAPELATGQGVDDRADVYALGAVAYHALTGQLPAAVADGRGASAHVSVLQRQSSASPVLAALIDQMLAPHAADRPNAAEVRVAAEMIAARAVPRQLPSLPSVRARTPTPTAPFRSLPRFSAPRWTPPIGITSDQAPQVAGEIGTQTHVKVSS